MGSIREGIGEQMGFFWWMGVTTETKECPISCFKNKYLANKKKEGRGKEYALVHPLPSSYPLSLCVCVCVDVRQQAFPNKPQ